MKRLLKQVIIAAVFFLVVGLIVYFSFINDSASPTPLPSVFIPPPEIISRGFIQISDFDYDFWATIKNPNIDLGASNVFYEVSIFDQDNSLIDVLFGSINLLPGQTRYEIISPIKTNRKVSDIVFKITNVDWQKLKQYIPSQSLFLVKNQEYLSDTTPRLRATLFNNSNFDFDRVDVHIILFDENDKIIAVNKTDIRTFLARTDRFFEVRWLELFSGKFRRAEIEVYTDVFKNENFIKQYGTQENFQKLY